MRKISFFLVVIFLFSGCSRDNISYVKSITLDKEKDLYTLKLSYYDFSDAEENFKESVYSTEDIYTMAAQIMKDRQYNFRLCKNVYIGKSFLYDELNGAFFFVNSLKVTPCANIVFYVGKNVDIYAENILSPMYNLSLENGKVSGMIPLISDRNEILNTVIIEGVVTEILSESENTILAILTNNLKSTGYSFHNENLWARLSNIKTFFYTDNGELNIVINFSVKERKGIGDSISSKSVFDNLLKKEMANKVYEIYENIHVAQIYNLHWFCTQTGKTCHGINVHVNITDM
ncbi:MAG: hypothetical protein IKU54_02345 [Oscillospiraceae bacterium]|nr:hypothetical protein [Oscillospiraceae bacterium]